jgi:hypothetical protein
MFWLCVSEAQLRLLIELLEYDDGYHILEESSGGYTSEDWMELLVHFTALLKKKQELDDLGLRIV